MFRGQFAHTIDAKGRVSLPARFRDGLLSGGDPRFILTPALFDPCLHLHPIRAWEELEQKINDLPSFDPNIVRFRRLYVSAAIECELDKAGRVLGLAGDARKGFARKGRHLGGNGSHGRALGEREVGRSVDSRSGGRGSVPEGRDGAHPRMTIEMTTTDERPVFEHVTVMAGEVLEALEPARGGVFLDVTAGGGGHSAAILAAGPHARVIAFDRDPVAVEAAKERLREFGERALVVHSAFGDVPDWLADANVEAVAGVVADLGLSSVQLGDHERGMSFRLEGPLDMRMDPTSGETAWELVRRLKQDALADVIYQYGEERRSRRVASCIKKAIQAGELETTLDLRRAVVRAVGPRRVGGIDPATRTFQALRIYVNRELEQLEALLAWLPSVVAPDGVAAIISFHSLEDRLVKRAFLERETWQRLTTKPRLASDLEQEKNPRSRSAKLRAARRVGEEM